MTGVELVKAMLNSGWCSVPCIEKVVIDDDEFDGFRTCNAHNKIIVELDNDGELTNILDNYAFDVGDVQPYNPKNGEILTAKIINNQG